jgi:HPt (histidine-containing phosphotransfer) domain-containing protein
LKNILDREALLERVIGDEDLAKELLQMFLEDIPDRLKAIKQAQESGDMETVILEAHTIKGSSGNIGANDISKAAFQVELAGKDANQETTPSFIKQLEDDFEVFRKTLADMDK